LVGFFSRLSDNRTVAAVVKSIEPLLRGGEVHDEFSPAFCAQVTRRATLRVLGNEPALLGFIMGATVEYAGVFGGKLSEERRTQIVMHVFSTLFGKNDLDEFMSFWRTNQDKQPFEEGVAVGKRTVAYAFGRDYSRDPDAAEAIAVGRRIESYASEIIRVVKPGDERLQLFSGMLWLHFTAAYTERRGC
jgi:hypothetical protein